MTVLAIVTSLVVAVLAIQILREIHRQEDLQRPILACLNDDEPADEGEPVNEFESVPADAGSNLDWVDAIYIDAELGPGR